MPEPDANAGTATATPKAGKGAGSGDAKLSDLQAALADRDRLLTEQGAQLARLTELAQRQDRALAEAQVERQLQKWSELEIKLADVTDPVSGTTSPGKTVKATLPPAVAQLYRDFKLTETAIPVERFIDAMLATPPVILSEIGSGLTQEGDHPNDPAQAGGVILREDGLAVTGSDDVRLAQEWAKAQGKDFTDPDVKMAAYDAVERSKRAKTRNGTTERSY